MKKNDRGLLGLLLALCMTLLLVTPALAGVTDVTGGSGVTRKGRCLFPRLRRQVCLCGSARTGRGAAVSVCQKLFI